MPLVEVIIRSERRRVWTLALPVPAAGQHPRNAAAWPCAVRAAGQPSFCDLPTKLIVLWWRIFGLW